MLCVVSSEQEKNNNLCSIAAVIQRLNRINDRTLNGQVLVLARSPSNLFAQRASVMMSTFVLSFNKTLLSSGNPMLGVICLVNLYCNRLQTVAIDRRTRSFVRPELAGSKR